jgi:hypothetical protein
MYFDRAMTSIVIRCSMTGAVHLDMIDCVDTLGFLLAVDGWLVLRPRPSVLMADGGTNFKGGNSAVQDMAKKGQINLAKAQSHFDTKFRFAPPRATRFRGLVEGFIEATQAAVHSAVHAHTFADKEFSAIFSRAMGRLNNVPIAYTVKSGADFHYLPLTLGHFLMGSAYAELQPIDTENTRLTNVTRYNRVCSVLEPFWERLVEELTTHLDGSVSKTRGVRVDDVALLLSPAGRGAAPLVRMARVRRGTDGEIRRMVCLDGFMYFDRAMTSIVIRCSTTGAVHLDMIDYVDTLSFLLAINRWLALRPRPSVLMADGGTNFKGGDSAVQDMAKKGQINLAKAQSHFDTKFRFAPPRAPHFRGLVEGFVGATKAAVHSAAHARTFADEEYFDRAVTSIVVRCSTTGAVHLDMMDCVDTSSFLLAVKGLLALGARPSVFMAESGTNCCDKASLSYISP